MESGSKVGDDDGGDGDGDGRILPGHPGPIPNAPRDNILYPVRVSPHSDVLFLMQSGGHFLNGSKKAQI